MGISFLYRDWRIANSFDVLVVLFLFEPPPKLFNSSQEQGRQGP